MNDKNALLDRLRENTMPTVADSAQIAVQSGYYSDKTLSEFLVKGYMAESLGMNPLLGARGIYTFQDGRGNIKIELDYKLVGAAIKRHERYDYEVTESTDQVATIVIWEKSKRDGEWFAHPAYSFTTDEAQNAGLMSKDNWRKYTRKMLLSKALKHATDTYAPDVILIPDYVTDADREELQGLADNALEQSGVHKIGGGEQKNTVLKDVPPVVRDDNDITAIAEQGTTVATGGQIAVQEGQPIESSVNATEALTADSTDSLSPEAQELLEEFQSRSRITAKFCKEFTPDIIAEWRAAGYTAEADTMDEKLHPTQVEAPTVTPPPQPVENQEDQPTETVSSPSMTDSDDEKTDPAQSESQAVASSTGTPPPSQTSVSALFDDEDLFQGGAEFGDVE